MINWNNIRPLNGSQHEGFEELICQLAKREQIGGQVDFVRAGKPDGGKECYWQLDNGDLYAWQAKYFTGSFNDSQWKQIDKSVIDTINHHNKLKKYFICCPLDRPDGKVDNRKSSLEKWMEKVKEWKAYALKKGMTIEIEYWGNSELVTRISARENEGLTYFWFNREEFNDEWFAYRNSESISALGGRYTATLNFELPIAKYFDGLARDERFVKRLNKHFAKLFEKYRSFRFPKEEIFTDYEQRLELLMANFKSDYLQTTFTGTKVINYRILEKTLYECQNLADEIDSALYKLRQEWEMNKPTPQYQSRPFATEMSDLQKLIDEIYTFYKFFDGPECTLSNLPICIVTGEAGAGKSHLLADIVEKRASRKQLSLLLLGESFTTKASPWSQILQHQLLKTNIDELTFLGALNAKAESHGSRLIIFIDALNEGEGRFIWPSKLESFIKLLEHYPFLGLVLSIRDSFVELIAPETLIHQKLAVRVKHIGFAEASYEASVMFFKYYGIIQPGSPLLNPEFQNPLFLKLFCQSLQKRGLSTIPPGYNGITVIIDFYLEGINYKLAQATEWEFDDKLKLVRKAVQNSVRQMVADNTDHLSYESASEIVEEVFKGKCAHPQPFLKRLISEGVFNEDLFWDDNGESYYVVYFAYQRFQDHIVASMLLDLYLDDKRPEISFSSGKLFELVKDYRALSIYNNLIEALSIQLPERIGMELFEVAPFCKMYHPVAEAFIKSLVWRKEDTITQMTKNFVNEVVMPDEDLFDQFLDTVISTTMKPGYYFNADSLHQYLSTFKMQERDLQWTTWLQDKYGPGSQQNAIKRLVDWAFDVDAVANIDDASIFLGVITMAWFLCSCNRYLRDCATKSMVNLLQHRLDLLVPLLEKFESVDDIYITERLYAVTYGCLLRSKHTKHVGQIADYTYQRIFNQKMVVAHVLLRDYARGVVEYARDKGIRIQADMIIVRPPYKSKKLPTRLPTVEAIDKKYEPQSDSGHYGNDNWGATAILSSMTTEYGRKMGGYGDFGRYVFGYTFSDFDIDQNRLSNYAVDLIFKMGYDPNLFTEFDNKQPSSRGSAHKERIGKKYQWIIMHELLARVSDNCVLYEKGYAPEDGVVKYEGPWMKGVRDLDPSMLIKKTKTDGYGDKAESPWLKKFSHRWEQDNHEWVRDSTGQPDPPQVILFKDQNDIDWLWLDLHPVWSQPDNLGEDKLQGPYKEVWYLIRSYFVKPNQIDSIKDKVANGFHASQFDEAKSLSNVFTREFYSAPSYLYFTDPEDENGDWISIHHDKTGKYIGHLLRTTEKYYWEEEYDCSKEDVIGFSKPAKILWNGLSLNYSSKEGELVDSNNELICFDPSVNHKSSRGLLVRKSAIDKFLAKEDLTLMWTVVGEKQVNSRSWKGKDYPGRMNMSGIYTYSNGGISGELFFKLD